MYLFLSLKIECSKGYQDKSTYSSLASCSLVLAPLKLLELHVVCKTLYMYMDWTINRAILSLYTIYSFHYAHVHLSSPSYTYIIMLHIALDSSSRPKLCTVCMLKRLLNKVIESKFRKQKWVMRLF